MLSPRSGWLAGLTVALLTATASAQVTLPPAVIIPSDPEIPRVSCEVRIYGEPNDCNDNNQCTEDKCVDGWCTNEALSGNKCNDGDVCTEPDVCLDGVCVGEEIDCDDDDSCTEDYCESVWQKAREARPVCRHDRMICEQDDNPCTKDECVDGACVPIPSTGQPCNDGDTCTDGDRCVVGVCVGSQFANCSDGNPCTDDICTASGGCANPPNNNPCNDGDACTESDTCQNSICVGGDLIDCDDGNLCSAEVGCDPVDGCLYEWFDCDDDDPCTIDTCDPETGACEGEDSWPWGDYCHEVLGDPWIIDPGVPSEMLVFVNNDDDNANGIPDNAEAGVIGENDLPPVSLVISGGSRFRWLWRCADVSMYTWQTVLPSSVGAFYLDSNGGERSEAGLLPTLPALVYIEGTHPTDACGVPANVGVGCGDWGWRGYWGSCFEWSENIRIVEVASLEWQETPANPNNPELDDCPTNGGRRIFPGKISPTDQFPQRRREVDLVATIQPPIPGVEVHFKVWDVDDRFDQDHVGMANVGLIDNNTSGPDNRPTPEEPRTFTANTYPVYDDNDHVVAAIARVTITVSMQPGNNYRAGASVLRDALDQPPAILANQALADAVNTRGVWFSGYSVPLVWSEMLTVWRKLHVELAAMQRPVFSQNTWSGNWTSAATFTAPGGGQIPERIIFDIHDLDVDNNQLEGGWIHIQGAGLAGLPSFRVFESLDDFFGNNTITVIMPNGIGALMGVTNGTFIVSDDDLSDRPLFDAGVIAPNAPGSFGADVNRFGLAFGASLPFPDVQDVDTLYAPAYILPVVDGINNGLVPFAQNLPQGPFGLPANTDPYFFPFLSIRSVASPVSTASFWTALVGSGFQSNLSEDADPEVQVTKGANPHANGSTSADRFFGQNYTGVCVVFVETADDAGGVAEYRIIAHEIAHTLGVPHNSRSTGMLMDEYPAGTPVFGASSLEGLRDYIQP